MAFDGSRIGAQMDSIGGGLIRIYGYDAGADGPEDLLTSAGYLPNATDWGLRVQDILLVRFTDVPAALFRVSEIDIDDTATLVPMESVQSVDASEWGLTETNTPAENLDVLRRVAAFLVELGGGTIEIPPGEYDLPDNDITKAPYEQSGDVFNLPSGVRVDNSGIVNGAIYAVGDFVAPSGDGVVTAGDILAGVQSFSGDYSAFAPGDIACIYKTGLGGADAQQLGVDFLTVVTASATTLTTSEVTRWPYSNYTIIKCEAAVKVADSLARGEKSISGYYTPFFAADDYIRIENLNGIDCPKGAGYIDEVLSGEDNAYFWYVTIKSIDISGIVLESELPYSFTDFWLVKANPVDDVGIDGGYVGQVRTEVVRRGKFHDFNGETFGNRYFYDLDVSHGQIASTQGNIVFFSQGSFLTYRGGIGSGVSSTGATAAVKFTGCVRSNIGLVNGRDITQPGAQAIVGIQLDAYVTPYNCWGDGNDLSGLYGERPAVTNGVSIVHFLQRNGIVRGLRASGAISFSFCESLQASSVFSDKRINWKSMGPNCHLHGFRTPILNIEGAPRNLITDGYITGSAEDEEDPTNHALLRILGGTAFLNSDDISIRDVICTTEVASHKFFYIRDALRVTISGCKDNAGIDYSIDADDTDHATSIDASAGNAFNNQVLHRPILIASGVADLTGWWLDNLAIDTQDGDATDDLDTISGMISGRVYVLKQINADRDITVKHNTGNIVLSGAADVLLGTTTARAVLVYEGVKVRDIFVGA